jgi:SAM-dependent methyltransferase
MMTKNAAGTDRELLTQHAYASDDKLQVRYRTHEKYTVPRVDFSGWVLDSIAWRGDEWVLDLGAGPGSYFEPVKSRIPWGRHYAADLSFGMVQRQQENAAATESKLYNADAQALPFPNHTFDVVLANHMLYHVPDIDRALAEIHRVLKPHGIVLAATNSSSNMPELNALFRRAVLLLTDFNYKNNYPESIDRPFALENAAQIVGRHFGAVARYDLPSALIFPEAAPVLAYLDSMRDLREPGLPADITWDAFMEQMADQVQRLIAHSGKLVVKKLSGVIIGTDSGGFAAEYVSRLRATRPA